MPKCKCEFHGKFSEQWTLSNEEKVLLKLSVGYASVHSIFKMIESLT